MKADSEFRHGEERELLKKSKKELLKGKGKLKEAAAYIEAEKERLNVRIMMKHLQGCILISLSGRKPNS